MDNTTGLNEYQSIQGTGSMNIQAIMKLLPHRYPFLLIDKVIDCVPGHHIVGIKNVSKNEPSISRTGKLASSIPHLLVIEALAQLSVVLAYKTLRLEPTGQELVFFAGIENGYFKGIPRPSAQLLLRSDVDKIRKKMGWFRARAEFEKDCIADVLMIAVIKSM